MAMLPVVCMHCGTSVADKFEAYEELMQKKEHSEQEILGGSKQNVKVAP